MSLSNLQAELAEIILTNDVDNELVTPPENIAVYHNNFYSTFISALKDTYPLIESLVGEDCFRTLAKEYAEQYPSRNSNLHFYGEYFSDFLASHDSLIELPYLSEVATFEWLTRNIYFAADHAPFPIANLENYTEEQYDQLHFVLHPAAQLKSFNYPILRIIDLCKQHLDVDVHLDEGGVNLLMIRRDLEIILSPLTLAEFTFLDLLQANRSLSESLHTALLIDADFNLEEKLPQWVQNKTLVDCYLSQD